MELEQVGIFGKHPSFGDFVAHGLPYRLREKVQTWLTETMGVTATQDHANWGAVFDAARPVRFWIGPHLLGMALRGVLVPSRDCVGRRFPLVAAQLDQTAVPPPLAPDQTVYDGLEAHLRTVMLRDLETARDLGPDAGFGDFETAVERPLWAVNPVATPADLLQAIASADYTHATGARSYWWCAPDDIRSGAVWSCEGLAGADALVWLMSGVGQAPQPDQDQSEAEQMQKATGDNRS